MPGGRRVSVSRFCGACACVRPCHLLIHVHTRDDGVDKERESTRKSLTYDSPRRVAPVADGMAVNLAVDAHLGHLGADGLQDLVARPPGQHMPARHVLQLVALAQALAQARGHAVSLGLAGPQHVPEMLRVRVEAHGGDAKVDVQQVAVRDGLVLEGVDAVFFVATGCRRPLGFANDRHVGLKPRRVVERLDLLAHPPLHVAGRGAPGDDDLFAEARRDDGPGRLLHAPVPGEPGPVAAGAAHGLRANVLDREHGLDDKPRRPIGSQRRRNGIPLSSVQTRREGNLWVRVDGDGGRLVRLEHGEKLFPHPRRVVDPGVFAARLATAAAAGLVARGQEELRGAPPRRKLRRRLEAPEDRFLGVLALAYLP